jgi:hypothetical protein
MITAALVITPALFAMPPTTASRVLAPRERSSRIPAQDEYVVVHAHPEQEHPGDTAERCRQDAIIGLLLRRRSLGGSRRPFPRRLPAAP